MTKLTPEAQAILDAGRDALSAPPGTKEEVLASVEASIANPAAGNALGQAAGGASSGKLLLVLALVAGIGGGLWLFSGDRDQAATKAKPVAVAEPEPVADPEPVAEPEPEPEPEPVAEPDPEPEPEPVAKPKKPKRKIEAPPSANTLLAERRLIAAAQVAIRKGDYARARSLLGEHKTQFPRGILAPERDAARAIALCLDDEQDSGADAARAFLRKHKNSPLAKRVKSSCDLP
jgi:outer membrane biosynthesis protein TonB